MNRMMTNWRMHSEWTGELEAVTPSQRLFAPARPIDLLDEDGPRDRQVPTARPSESFEVSAEIGRYLPLTDGTGVVAENGVGRSVLNFGPPSGLYDPALDEFLIGARFGDSHGHGPFGRGARVLGPIDSESDIPLVGTTADIAGDPDDVFISLPDGEQAVLVLLDDGLEVFGPYGGNTTFGGGDDPVWMLTLLPSPDGQTDDVWFGHPGSRFDLLG